MGGGSSRLDATIQLWQGREGGWWGKAMHSTNWIKGGQCVFEEFGPFSFSGQACSRAALTGICFAYAVLGCKMQCRGNGRAMGRTAKSHCSKVQTKAGNNTRQHDVCFIDSS